MNNMGGTARTLSYQHDAAGRRTRLTFPDGAFFAYEYDAAGNLTAVRENGGTVVASFNYHTHGRVSGQTVSGAGTSSRRASPATRWTMGICWRPSAMWRTTP
jgi:YD repeat-containing protein